MINEPKRKRPIAFDEAWERARFWPHNAMIFKAAGVRFHEMARDMISWVEIEVKYLARRHRFMFAAIFKQLIADGLTEDRAAAYAFLWVRHHAVQSKPYPSPEALIGMLRERDEFRDLFSATEIVPGGHARKAYAIIARSEAPDLAPYANTVKSFIPKGIWVTRTKLEPEKKNG